MTGRGTPPTTSSSAPPPAKTAGTNTVTPAPGTLSSPPPPPKPALDALFGVLASFPDGLPARAWAVAADVAVKPLVDLESRRKKIKMDSGKIRSGAIGSHAAAADWASSRVEPVLVSLCTLCSGSRVARAALLTPLIEALPAMTGSAREELAAHRVVRDAARRRDALRHVIRHVIFHRRARVVAASMGVGRDRARAAHRDRERLPGDVESGAVDDFEIVVEIFV